MLVSKQKPRKNVQLVNPASENTTWKAQTRRAWNVVKIELEFSDLTENSLKHIFPSLEKVQLDSFSLLAELFKIENALNYKYLKTF